MTARRLRSAVRPATEAEIRSAVAEGLADGILSEADARNLLRSVTDGAGRKSQS